MMALTFELKITFKPTYEDLLENKTTIESIARCLVIFIP